MLYFIYHVLSSGSSQHGFSVLLVANKGELNFKPISSQNCLYLIDSSHSHLHQQLASLNQPEDDCLDLTQQHIYLSGESFLFRSSLFFTVSSFEAEDIYTHNTLSPHLRDAWNIFC